MPSDASTLLQLVHDGSHRAADQLMPLIYDELRNVADKLLGRERPNHTLQATALVNEAYLKLVDQDQAHYATELHFGAIAARAMQRILVDHARGRNRQKRGDGAPVLALTTCDSGAGQHMQDVVDVLALEEALTDLNAEDPRAAQVVQLRYFGGFTITRTAQYLNASTATIERDWQYARAWLFDRLGEGDHVFGE